MPDSAPHAVFISYAREDTVAAQRVAEALRSHGIEVWFDQNELRGGEAWDSKIRKQIRECVLFMPVISAHTHERSEGYFRLEWKLAVERTHLMREGTPFLVPVVIDGAAEDAALVPEPFMRVQWTRLAGALPTAQFVEQVKRLLEAPRSASSGTASRSVSTHGAEAAPLQPNHVLKAVPKWVWVAGAIAVAAIVAWLGSWSASTPSVAVEKAKAKSSLDPRRIAVLPLRNFSSDGKDDYFSDSMTDEMISSLSKISGLTVIAHTSVMRYKTIPGKTPATVAEVGRDLQVGTVLEGSVLKAGEQLRITVQLIDVASQGHLWTSDYKRELKDVFAIQSEVAERVAEALKVRLLGGEKQRLAKAPTANLEAYQLYLVGRSHSLKGTREGTRKALECFNQAITLDADYALAYAGLADLYRTSSIVALALPEKVVRQNQREAARKALALDDTLAEAHIQAAYIKWTFDWDWAGGENEFKRAIELNPNYVFCHDEYAELLKRAGRFEEAIAEQKKALQLDPASPVINVDLARAFYSARRFDEAIRSCRRTLDLEPNFAEAYQVLGECFREQGNYSEAVRNLEKAVSLNDRPYWLTLLGHAWARAGNEFEARRILASLEGLAKQGTVNTELSAGIFLALGEKERALQLLEQAVENRNPQCIDYKVDPIFDPLRREPRFIALLKKIGFPE